MGLPLTLTFTHSLVTIHVFLSISSIRKCIRAQIYAHIYISYTHAVGARQFVCAVCRCCSSCFCGARWSTATLAYRARARANAVVYTQKKESPQKNPSKNVKHFSDWFNCVRVCAYVWCAVCACVARTGKIARKCSVSYAGIVVYATNFVHTPYIYHVSLAMIRWCVSCVVLSASAAFVRWFDLFFAIHLIRTHSGWLRFLVFHIKPFDTVAELHLFCM